MSEANGERSASSAHIRPQFHHHDIATPNFDVHENASAFFLEGEFPGLLISAMS